jgi:hypothetical protein
LFLDDCCDSLELLFEDDDDDCDDGIVEVLPLEEVSEDDCDDDEDCLLLVLLFFVLSVLRLGESRNIFRSSANAVDTSRNSEHVLRSLCNSTSCLDTISSRRDILVTYFDSKRASLRSNFSTDDIDTTPLLLLMLLLLSVDTSCPGRDDGGGGDPTTSNGGIGSLTSVNLSSLSPSLE